ncbi:pilus assembly protein TadG-related protein [Leifsonia sp. A12D58]|uniref:pilus assembly protein TadG-related protein n=1 Tax=Leifsonia sp. A12D58 TaxID=3397674 RepID=UPI0039E07AF5
MSRHRHNDDGTILILTMFFSALALVVILVVTAATSLYLERKRLFSLADGAALAGAESFEIDEMSIVDGQAHPMLTPGAVHEAVQEYVDGASHARFEGLSIGRATTVDGSSATVTLHAYWRPPVVSWVLPAGVPLDVTSIGRSVFW